MATPEARLATELQLYAARKPEWLKQHSGSYVVAKDDLVLGFYSTFKEAYIEGVRKWGIKTDFLVKQVVEHEPVFFVF